MSDALVYLTVLVFSGESQVVIQELSLVEVSGVWSLTDRIHSPHARMLS